MKQKSVIFLMMSLFILLLAFSGEAKPPSKEYLLKLLSGYESIPLNEIWKKLDKDTYKLLIDIASYKEEAPLLRARALLALSNYPNPTVKRFLIGFIASSENELILKRNAIRALGRGFKDKALPFLAEYLRNSDLYIREVTVYTLSEIKNKKAILLLRKRLREEDSEMIRELIQKVLKEMEAYR